MSRTSVINRPLPSVPTWLFRPLHTRMVGGVGRLEAVVYPVQIVASHDLTLIVGRHFLERALPIASTTSLKPPSMALLVSIFRACSLGELNITAVAAVTI
jgi:hypothetical protein